MKLVLVHGIFNTGHVMGWMRRQFERQGYECLTPTLAPFDGRRGIAHSAKQLQRFIDASIAEDEPISLIGFSMGGIVARYYLQHLDGHKRTKALFSISSPHHGSYLAWLPYPSMAMRELRPRSELLCQLARSESRLTGIDLYSFRTPIDFTIVPSRSSHWPLAENRVIWCPLHLSMIFSRRVVAEILMGLMQLPARANSAPEAGERLQGAED
ncbi:MULTISPECIES: esterase/lipase family protein [Shewanella]|uniref:Alpha/beta fold hydrolase n=1 Tax=Shewanella marisflavi TaxID=260364 RepID=A0ABX5WR00_9GAMM|nr:MULTISPECIES: alpha/beta fold hydrolase [Shewanella]QDF76611.1 alpha/beta fold hydrolase [Shewanella marisflavi]